MIKHSFIFFVAQKLTEKKNRAIAPLSNCYNWMASVKQNGKNTALLAITSVNKSPMMIKCVFTKMETGTQQRYHLLSQPSRWMVEDALVQMERTGVPGLALRETNMVRGNNRKKQKNCSWGMPLLNTKDKELLSTQKVRKKSLLYI